MTEDAGVKCTEGPSDEVGLLDNLLFDVLKDVLAKYGPFSVLLILFLMWHMRYIHKLWTGRLRDKDAEIERLVQERNRLQEEFMKKRISTKDE